MATNQTYIAIDLKSFYASVECVERKLNPLDTNLVVADVSRTEKTICLAVSPSLKAYKIAGRVRLFEVVEKVRQINAERKLKVPKHSFNGKSFIDSELKANPSLELSYISAPPRMGLYMEYSTKIYQIYLKYVAPEDIHVYSIDEVFIDVTHYLKTYNLTPRELTIKIINDVFRSTGITATAGIGTNLYLAKVAMDVQAKHIKADSNGVRIAELDEMSYRKNLWSHTPLTDFWRVGKGYRDKLEAVGIKTMGDVARCSIGKKNEYYNEDLLYKIFGVNAELLIDHAWGYEPCTIKSIKEYKPLANSISSGQVLSCGYTFEKARLIVQEMTDLLVLDLVKKELLTDQIVLEVGYDTESLTNGNIKYNGEISLDRYGRKVPKHAHGTENIPRLTSSTELIMNAVTTLFDRVVDKNLLVRRIYVTACKLSSEEDAKKAQQFEQLSFFTDEEQLKVQEEALKRENKLQKAVIKIKGRYGKNSVLKGMNFIEGATTISRNNQIGGHKK